MHHLSFVIIYTAVNCGPAPAANPNGVVAVGATTFRSTAIYSCNVGFILDISNGGSQQIECQANAQWSGIAGGCIRKYYSFKKQLLIIILSVGINCGYLATPSNGELEISPDTRLASSATFSCIRGFRLEGDSVRVCQSNGDYSGEQPSCISELSNIITRKL